MNRLRVLWLPLLIAVVPSTASAPVGTVASVAPVEILADGFLDLRGVAVGADGAVYVADREAGTVTRIAADGSRSTAATGLSHPVGVALDTTGRVLIAEEGAGRIVGVDSSGRVTPIASDLIAPQWIAVSDDGTLHVTASGLAAQHLPPVPGTSGNSQMILAVTSNGQPRVLLDHLDGVQGVTAAGNVLYAATRSAPAGAILQVAMLPDGTAASATEAPGNLSVQPVGMARDRAGALVVTARALDTSDDPTKRTLLRLQPDGTQAQVATGLANPQGIALHPNGDVYVADGVSGRLLRFRAPPAPTLGALPEWTNRSTLAVAVSAQAGAQVTLTVNDAATPVRGLADPSGAASLVVPLAANQSNRLVAFAIGAGGAGLASSPAEAVVGHDDLPPSVDPRTPATGSFVRRTVSLEALAADGGSGVDRFELAVDGRWLPLGLVPAPPAPSVTAAGTWDTSDIGEGTHTLIATATDRAGNVTSTQAVVIVDRTPPSTRITGVTIDGASATFSFTGRDNLAAVDRLQFAWRLDGGVFSAFSSATTARFAGLAPGRHAFEVKARDVAGNEDPAPAERTIQITSSAVAAVDARDGPRRGLRLAPADGVVIRGSATTFTVSATADGRGEGRVELAVSGLPAGLTATFSPAAIVGKQSATLVVRAMATAPAGLSSFTVTGTERTARGAVESSASGTLTVLEDGRTALIGRVVDTDRAPLAGVAILIGGQRAVTDASGNFVVLDPPAGEQVVLIDGEPASDAERHYPTIPASVTIVAGRVNELPYLPHLHRQQHVNFTAIDHGRETVATDPALPGVKLRIPAGTWIVGWDGRAAEKVSIRTVPVDRLPVRPVPPAVRASTVYMFYFGKRGGGVPSQPVPFEAPNELGLAPGEKAELWYFDESPNPGEAPNDWRIAGTGTVSADGRTIGTDPGVGIPKFCCGAALWNPGNLGNNTKPGLAPQAGQELLAGDPVDLSTGIFMMTKTDLALPGVLPLALTRTYRSGDSYPGPFGYGTTLGYEEFLQRTSATVITYVYRANARTVFTQQADGTFTNGAVLAFRGAAITANADGTYTLRYKDGRSVGFDGGGLQQWVRDRNGNQVTIGRATESNATTIVGPSGRSLTLGWWLTGRDVVVQASDSSGRTVGYIPQITDAAGGITVYGNDSQGRLATITDARGITYLTNTYDVNSRVCRQQQADGAQLTLYYVTADIATTPASIQLVQEAAAGGPITQVPCSAAASSSPVVTTVLVDGRGHPTTYRFSGAGWLIGVTDALGQETTYEREAASNLITAVTDPLGRRMAYTYDGNGNVTSVTRLAGTADAVTTTFTYEGTYSQVTSVTDPLGHTTTFEYDGHGNLTRITDPLGHQTTITNNAAGQPVTLTDALGNTTQFGYSGGDLVSVTDPVGQTTTRTVDAAGRIVGITNALGQQTAYEYDPLNHVTRITDALAGVTNFTYDPNGNLVAVQDAVGNITGYTYDGMDRVAARTDPLAHAETYAYDLGGNLTTFTDRKGQVTSTSYDALNRRTQATYADGSTTTYTWDAGDRLTQVVDSISGTITRTYDLLDRLTQEVTPQGTVSYAYDAAGRRTSMTVAGQPAVTYAYDDANRLTEIVQGTQVVSFAYDAANRRTSLTLPNGVVTEYSYDAASRLTGLTYRNGAGVLGTLTYGYDRAGSRAEVGGTWARTGLPPALASATYGPGNRQLTFETSTLTYDLNGNLTSDGTTTYTWDARDWLIGFANAAMTAAFQYDAIGRRIGKTFDGVATTVLHHGQDTTQETTGTSVRNILTGLGIDEHLGHASATGESRWALTEALGSTMALVDGTGAVTTEYSYEPFGNTTTWGAPSENRAQYTGRENDPSGLYYYRARYYNPRLQRFISEDPVGFAGGDVNLHAYVGNSPVQLRDPLGLYTVEYPVPDPECIELGGRKDECRRPGRADPPPPMLACAAGCAGDLAIIIMGGAAGALIIHQAMQKLPSLNWEDLFSFGRNNEDSTVADVLKGKKGSIKQAPLPPGSPSWDEIRDKRMSEIDKAAKENRPGYRQIRKLLGDKRFDK